MAIQPRRRIFRRSRPSGKGLRSAFLFFLLVAMGAGGVDVAAGWVGPMHSEIIQLSARPGAVAVVDGDTLRLQDQVVRLAGLRAPSRGDTCKAIGKPALGNLSAGGSDCADAAAASLSRLLADQTVQCNLLGEDPMGRATARCTAGNLELNRAVVESGWARAESGEYAAAENDARASHRGLWATTY